MRLDPVHDLQAVFRQLMLAAAFPGSLRPIGEEAARIDIDVPLPKPMLAIALALLDAEVGFAFSSESTEERAALVSRMTYARRVPAAQADFVFVLGGEEMLAGAIEAARPGNLVDPQLGATLVAFVDSLEEGPPIALSGPGIETAATLRAGPSALWLGARREKNREYPLGVDLFFADSLGRVAALPRTTRAEEAAWAT